MGVIRFVQGEEAAECRAGVRIDQMDLAQVPRCRPHAEALEMSVTGRHFEADAL